MRRALSFVEKFFDKFTADDTTTLAASLAFYTALSMAPLLILFITIATQFSPGLQVSFQEQVRSLVGSDAAVAIEMVINSAKERPDLTSLASVLGVLTLLLSASLIFGELRSALNRIFECRKPEEETVGLTHLAWRFAKQHIFHIGLALSFIFILIVSLVISSLLASSLGKPTSGIKVVMDITVSVLFYIGMFTMMFRYLPDHRLSWSRAFRGGAITALLFVVGKQLIGVYLGNSAVGSSYGAAGSVVVLLVWVYYSAIITFMGAQVSSLLTSRKARAA